MNLSELIINLNNQSQYKLDYCTPYIKEYCIDSGLMTINSNINIILIFIGIIFLLLFYIILKKENGK